jgi:hypothetical protein
MEKLPLLLSPPRTRSTIIYELMSNYLNKRYGLLKIQNHSELFLQFNAGFFVINNKTHQQNITEMFPLLKHDGIHMHFVYPHVFNSLKERNLYKFDLLRKAKKSGMEFHIKCTLQITETLDEFVDFFKDRKIVITKRRNLANQLCSFLFAHHNKMFHARNNSEHLQTYKALIKNGCTINFEEYANEIEYVIDRTRRLYAIEKIFECKNIDYDVVYYEDTNTEEKLFSEIDRILANSNWRNYLESYNDFVVKKEIDYSKVILNYDELSEKIHFLLKTVKTT